MAFAILRFSRTELPNSGTLPFTDVLVIRISAIMVTLNQKSISNTTYVNWKTFALEIWKRS